MLCHWLAFLALKGNRSLEPVKIIIKTYLKKFVWKRKKITAGK
jgi:hypothetical protein